MTDANDRPCESDVARWHRLSGMPDNVTDDGDVVSGTPGLRLQAEKRQLRSALAQLRDGDASEEAKALGRLAASYLLAGDAETARRYLDRASALADMHS